MPIRYSWIEYLPHPNTDITIFLELLRNCSGINFMHFLQYTHPLLLPTHAWLVSGNLPISKEVRDGEYVETWQ